MAFPVTGVREFVHDPDRIVTLSAAATDFVSGEVVIVVTNIEPPGPSPLVIGSDLWTDVGVAVVLDGADLRVIETGTSNDLARRPDDDHEFDVFEQSAIAVAAAARDRFDLLSVIAHELGHHAWWNYTEDGFMSDRLSPGERRLPHSVDPDDRFAAFTDLDELLGLS